MRDISLDLARAVTHDGPNRAAIERMTNAPTAPTHLSSTDLARLRRKLEQKRDALLASERDAQDAARGVTDEAIEDVDIAERMIEQDSALRQAVVDRKSVV